MACCGDVWCGSMVSYGMKYTVYGYTARNATDVKQVVDFTSLMQIVIKLNQACWLHQVAPSLAKVRLDAT